MMKWMTLGILAILATAILPGCQSKEGMILLDQANKRKTERVALLQQPSKYIVPEQWNKVDKRIVNRHTKATAVIFANNSVFDVDEIEGLMAYKAADGTVMAVVSFTATGTILAGQVKKLPVKAGDASGSAHNAVIRVVRVHIINQ